MGEGRAVRGKKRWARDEIFNRTLLSSLGAMIIRKGMDRGRFCRERFYCIPCAALLAYDSLEHNHPARWCNWKKDNHPVAVKRLSPVPLTNKSKRVLARLNEIIIRAAAKKISGRTIFIISIPSSVLSTAHKS